MRLVPNVVGVASAPEGTVISFSCNDSNQSLVGVNRATCVEGVWIPDVNGVMCKGINGLFNLFHWYCHCYNNRDEHMFSFI